MSDVPIQLGHYRLGKTLGIGSFGKVKRAFPYFISLLLSFERRRWARTDALTVVAGGCCYVDARDGTSSGGARDHGP